jgi:hypothetical protein
LHSGDEQPHEIVVESLAEDGSVSSVIGRAPMRVAGQSYAYQVDDPGVLRVHSKKDPGDKAYVVVSSGAAAVTDLRGRAVLELPAGARELTLWHPPFPDHRAGLSKKLKVEVVAAKRKKRDVALGSIVD